MGRRKLPRELKKHPHTLVDLSLWEAANQLELVPWELHDERLNSLFFLSMSTVDRRRERAHQRREAGARLLAADRGQREPS